MSTVLSELLGEIAGRASELDKPILAHLCRMAAIEAAHVEVPISWQWNAAESPSPLTAVSNDSSGLGQTTLNKAIAKPYQVWTTSGTGIYSVMVPNAKEALATVVQLSGRGHKDISIKDMDGREIELAVLKMMVELEANPTLQLVSR